MKRILSVTLTAVLLCLGSLLTPVAALEDTDSEKEGRKACEAKVCQAILDKSKAKGGSLTCDIGRTWGKAKIKEGADSKNIKWSFGDARCQMSLKIPHRAVVNALTRPKFTFSAPAHTVSCDVEMGNGIKPVRAVFEPKLKFEGGRVKKAWVGLKEIDGPALLKGLVWTTAQLEDSLGIFHSEMVKEINKFIHKTCVEEHGPDGGKDKKDGKAKKKDEVAKKKEATEKKTAKSKADSDKGGDAKAATGAAKPPEAKKAAKTEKSPEEDNAAKPAEAEPDQAKPDTKSVPLNEADPKEAAKAAPPEKSDAAKASDGATATDDKSAQD